MNEHGYCPFTVTVTNNDKNKTKNDVSFYLAVETF